MSNILIAKFVGYKCIKEGSNFRIITPTNKITDILCKKEQDCWLELNELYLDCNINWNSLIKVVVICNNIENSFSIWEKTLGKSELINEAIMDNNITIVYNEVVNFIKLLNNQNET